MISGNSLVLTWVAETALGLLATCLILISKALGFTCLPQF
jgi:hypothetical protein